MRGQRACQCLKSGRRPAHTCGAGRWVSLGSGSSGSPGGSATWIDSGGSSGFWVGLFSAMKPPVARVRGRLAPGSHRGPPWREAAYSRRTTAGRLGKHPGSSIVAIARGNFPAERPIGISSVAKDQGHQRTGADEQEGQAAPRRGGLCDRDGIQCEIGVKADSETGTAWV